MSSGDKPAAMDFGSIDALIARHGVFAAICASAPYVNDLRRARIERVLHGRLRSLRVASENPEDPRNAAAIVRTAEALGVMRVDVIGAAEGALHARKTTQGAYHWVHTQHHGDTAQFLERTRADGFLLAGATMNGGYTLDELPVDRPLCVVFGNEGIGLSQALLAACDLTYRIPMVGMSESLNLSVSAAITLYRLTRARRDHLGKDGDLEGASYLLEKARYYLKSLEPRLRDALFA